MAATRRFATGDGINLDVGGNAAFTTDAFTFAAVFQQGADGTEFDLLRGWTSGFALLWSISTDTTTNRLTYTEAATGTRGQSAFTVTQADGWVLVAASKPAGTSTIVWSKYVFATKTWTQSNDVLGTVGTSAALGAGSHFQIAAATGGTGDYAGSALWSGVTFTNAQVQALAVSWHDWFAANPTAMWVLNQSATTFNIKDWVGSSDQTFISGTTISPSASPLVEAETGPVLNRVQPARLSPASFPRVPYSASPLPDQVSRTSIYSISNFGSSLPAEWTGSGSTGSVEGVNASRLELTTGTLGTFTDYARADLTATGTTSMADVDGYVSFEITNPNAEQYITFYARASNDWANGDNPDTSIGFQLDYRGRPDIVHRFHTGTKTLIANSVTVNHVPMTNGALYWCHFRVIGDWVFCSWWSGLQTDEPKNGDGSFAWTQYGHQLLVPSAGMFKIINAGGTAATAKNMYVHSVDIGTTVAGAAATINVTGSLFAGPAAWATATADLSVTGIAPVGRAAYLGTVGVGLAGVLEVGTDSTATVSGDRSVTGMVPAEATARLGTVGVGLAGLLEAGTAPRTTATADLSVTGMVPAEATARLGTVGVGLSGVLEVGETPNLGTVGVGLSGLLPAGSNATLTPIGVGLSGVLEVGETSNLGTVGVGLSGVVEAGATARLPTVGVGLAGLLEAGPSAFAPATRDAAVTALVPVGESASLGTIGVGLAGLLEAAATGRLGTIGVGLSALLEAGTAPRATATADISVTGIVPATGVPFSPATITVSLAGLLPIGASGSELVGTVAIINVAGLALMGVTARATATLDATATGIVETGATSRATTTANLAPVGYVDVGATASGVVTTALTVNVAGLTLMGITARATTTANLAPVGFLGAGATDRATVTANLTAAGLLAAGAVAFPAGYGNDYTGSDYGGSGVTADLAVAAQLLTGAPSFATVTRSTTTTGWVALGTTANGTLVTIFRAADGRLIVVRGELRTVGVEGDDRLVAVYGTSRVVGVEGEDRIIPATRRLSVIAVLP